jgi:hypothetical protein
VVTYVCVADVDGDGQRDVLSASGFPDNTVAWCRNLGGGSFGWNESVPLGNRQVLSTADRSPTSISAGDLNGDGNCDVVLTARNDQSLTWLKGNGPPSAPTFTRYVISNTQTGAKAAAIGDVDGDGWPDLVCAAQAVNRVTWFRNTTHDAAPAAPFFGPGQIISANVGAASDVRLGDLNSDGWLDVVVAAAAGATGSKLSWYENLGGGSFGWNAAVPAANEKLVYTPAVWAGVVLTADLNQDAVVDVVGGLTESGKVAAYVNRGGQSALATVDTAPATLKEGRREDLLRIGVSHRGIAGDHALRIAALSLQLEKSPGVALSSEEANALIDTLQVYVDSNGSGSFEAGVDALVGSVGELALAAGRQSVSLSLGPPGDAQVAAGATRYYFVVVRLALGGAGQSVHSFRIKHVSHGPGRSLLQDATTAAILTVESEAVSNAPSTFTTALPAQTYADFSYLYFGEPGAVGTGPLDDFDFDGMANLAEFAFGTDPAANLSPTISVSGGVLLQHGFPTALATNTGTGVNFQAIFGRRKDALAGLTYAVQFSANLQSWVTSTATPTVLADDGVIEAVAVPYPFFVNGKKARFFRVNVTSQ